MGLLKKLTAKPSEEPPADWPSVNESVWVRLACCESDVHPARVESFTAQTLTITAPMLPHPSPVDPPEEGKTFLVGWSEGGASKQARFEFRHCNNMPIATWTIASVSDSQMLQRRSFVRADWEAAIKLHLIKGALVGTTHDISEGGARCTFPATTEPREARFPVSFTIDKEPVMIDAEVAWWGTPRHDVVQVGLTFVTEDQILSDRLRAHAFALQLEERRNRLA